MNDKPTLEQQKLLLLISAEGCEKGREGREQEIEALAQAWEKLADGSSDARYQAVLYACIADLRQLIEIKELNMMKEIIELLENISENRIFHHDSMDQNTYLERKVQEMIEKLKSDNSDYVTELNEILSVWLGDDGDTDAIKDNISKDIQRLNIGHFV